MYHMFTTAIALLGKKTPTIHFKMLNLVTLKLT